MKKLQCEMCASTDFVKQDGLFVCQTCGAKYTVEEARKMMIEGTVEVKGTVKVDSSDELANLYQIARRAKDDNNSENAARYYDMILVKDPTSWEAAFYTVYFKAMSCVVANMGLAVNSVMNCLDSVLMLIKDYVSDKAEQVRAVQEVTARSINLAGIFYSSLHATFHLRERVISLCYRLGDCIDQTFRDYPELHLSAALSWKEGIQLHHDLFSNTEPPKITLSYAEKVQKYDTSYQPPAPPKPKNHLLDWGVICGTAGLILACIGFALLWIGLVGAFFALIGSVLCGFGLKRAKALGQNTIFPITGIVINAVALLIFIIDVILVCTVWAAI